MICSWATSDEGIKYHNEEWCQHSNDEFYLFEMLCLEGMQAGLSWNLILKRREEYKKAYFNFDYNLVSLMSDTDLLNLKTNDINIVKNTLKIKAIRTNAQEFIKVQKEFGSFYKYIWSFTEKQIVNKTNIFNTENEISNEISKDLKKKRI